MWSNDNLIWESCSDPTLSQTTPHDGNEMLSCFQNLGEVTRQLWCSLCCTPSTSSQNIMVDMTDKIINDETTPPESGVDTPTSVNSHNTSYQLSSLLDPSPDNLPGMGEPQTTKNDSGTSSHGHPLPHRWYPDQIPPRYASGCSCKTPSTQISFFPRSCFVLGGLLKGVGDFWLWYAWYGRFFYPLWCIEGLCLLILFVLWVDWFGWRVEVEVCGEEGGCGGVGYVFGLSDWGDWRWKNLMRPVNFILWSHIWLGDWESRWYRSWGRLVSEVGVWFSLRQRCEAHVQSVVRSIVSDIVFLLLRHMRS